MSRALPPPDSPWRDHVAPPLTDPESRGTFLAGLGRKLATVSDPDELVAVAMRETGERLQVHRAFFCEVDTADGAHAHVLPDWHRDGGGLAGTYALASFGADACWQAAAAGVVAIDDVWRHPWTAAYAAGYAALDIGAWLLAPFARDGRWVASLVVSEPAPRTWTREECVLLEHVAARVWPLVERARTARDLESTRQVAAQQARLFSVTLAAVRDYVFTFEPDGRFAFANASLLRLWERSADQAIGRSMGELGYAPEVERQLLDDMQRVIATGTSVAGETPYRSPSGMTAHYEYVLSPVFDDDGQVVQVAGTARDVTQRRVAEATLAAALDRERAARADAERNVRIKDDFLATLSHELRTPLNAILGWAQMIRRPDAVADDIHRGLAVIERNARAQAQLIDDLLDMSRITSGTLRLDVQPVLIRDVLEAAMAAARPAAEAKHLTLSTECEPASLVAAADPQRFQQVVWNLVSNAVKFTPPGGTVLITARVVDDGLEVAVADTGVGIAAEFLPHVFDPFRQADASTTRRHGGLGLGLAIVKHLVELHGGAAGVQSDGVGRGARFVVTLPLTEAGMHADGVTTPDADGRVEPPAAPGPCRTLEGLDVLIVDDEEDVRLLSKHIVERCGASVRLAGSAEEAKHVLQTHRVDVLVSDVGMPGQDGYALLRDLRARGHRVPAIAVTAFDGDETARASAAAGFQYHLAKPIAPETLVEAIAAVVVATRPAASPVTSTSREELRS